MRLAALTLSTVVALFWGASLDAQADGGAIDRSLNRLVKKVRPVVVGVNVYEHVPSDEAEPGTTDVAGSDFVRVTRLTGSGMVWSPKGDIVTLLEHGLPELESPGGTLSIEVKLHDESIYPATLVAVDEHTGIAVLRMQSVPRGLKYVKPQPVKVEVGDLVLSLGAAGGEPSVGMVRNPNRIVHGRGRLLCPRGILTDIPAYPGDVGGILANKDGRIIGMMAFEASAQSGLQRAPRGMNANEVEVESGSGNPGQVIGFPVEILAKIVTQLRSEKGKVVRGHFGASFRPMNISSLTQGQRVVPKLTDVQKGGPCHQAGLREGHIILQVDEHFMKRSTDVQWFAERVQYGEIGDVMSIKYTVCEDGRLGVIHTVQVEIVPEDSLGAVDGDN